MVAQNVYFILYGSFSFETEETGKFGSLMCVGHTLGEEIVFATDTSLISLRRTESVVSDAVSCVL